MCESPGVGERLLSALVAAFGDDPRWELGPNRTYGYYLRYNYGCVPMKDIRDVIDATLNFSVGVILAPRGPLPGEPPGLAYPPQ